MTNLQINFLPNTSKAFWKAVGEKELIRPINIFPANTLASNVNNMLDVSDWSYNKYWVTEKLLPNGYIELVEGEFILMLTVIFNYEESINCCAADLNHKILISLNR